MRDGTSRRSRISFSHIRTLKTKTYLGDEAFSSSKYPLLSSRLNSSCQGCYCSRALHSAFFFALYIRSIPFFFVFDMLVVNSFWTFLSLFIFGQGI